MRTHLRHALAAILTLAALTSCDNGLQSSAFKIADLEPNFNMVADTAPNRAAPAPMQLASATVDAAIWTTLAASQPERRLVKNATLRLEVKNAPRAAITIAQTAKANGGYVADSSQHRLDLNRDDVTITIRVPVEKFDETLATLRSYGTVQSFTAATEDITEKYVDVDARARNLRQSESRLLGILSTASDLDGTLKIEQELTRVRGEIETLEGRLRLLSNQSAFSTIAVTLQPQHFVVANNVFSIGAIAGNAIKALLDFAEHFLEVLIWILIWILVWTPVWVSPILLLDRLRKRLALRRASIQS